MAVAAITGVAGGVGEAVASGFAEAVLHAALLDRDWPCSTDCPRKISLAADLTRPDEFDAEFGRTWDEFGRFDAGVNVADIKRRAPVPQMNADEWARMLDAGFGSMFLTARLRIALLEPGNGQAIVSLNSISGHAAAPDCPPVS